MKRTYKSKKDTYGALDPKDVVLGVDEKSSVFDAFYINNIKQTKRELSCFGSSSQHYVPGKGKKKKKYVKRIIKEVEPEVCESPSHTKSTCLTPNKSLRVNKGADLFDQLFNSSVTPKCGKKLDAFDMLLSNREENSYVPKKNAYKKYNCSTDSEDEGKENEDDYNKGQDEADLRTHKLLFENDCKEPKAESDSMNALWQKLNQNRKSYLFKNSKSDILFNKLLHNRLTTSSQSPRGINSPLTSTPVSTKYRGQSIYKFSPIPQPNFDNVLREKKNCVQENCSNCSNPSIDKSEQQVSIGNNNKSQEISNYETKVLNETSKSDSSIQNRNSVNNVFNTSTEAGPFLGFSIRVPNSTESLSEAENLIHLNSIESDNNKTFNSSMMDHNKNSSCTTVLELKDTSDCLINKSEELFNSFDNDEIENSNVNVDQIKSQEYAGDSSDRSQETNISKESFYDACSSSSNVSLERENCVEKKCYVSVKRLRDSYLKEFSNKTTKCPLKIVMQGQGNINDNLECKNNTICMNLSDNSHYTSIRANDYNEDISNVSQNVDAFHDVTFNNNSEESCSISQTLENDVQGHNNTNVNLEILECENIAICVHLDNNAQSISNRSADSNKNSSINNQDVTYKSYQNSENNGLDVIIGEEVCDVSQNLMGNDLNVVIGEEFDSISQNSENNGFSANTSFNGKTIENHKTETEVFNVCLNRTVPHEEADNSCAIYSTEADQTLDESDVEEENKYISFVTTRRRNDFGNNSIIFLMNNSNDSDTNKEYSNADLSIIEQNNRSSPVFQNKRKSENIDVTVMETFGEVNDCIEEITQENPNTSTTKCLVDVIPNTTFEPQKPFIVLQPGKKWERSLSIYRRMTLVNDEFDESILDDESLNTKGRKYRQSIIETMELQENRGSVYNDSHTQRRSTIVSKSYKPTVKIIKEPSSSRFSIYSTNYEDLSGFVSEDCDDTLVELSHLSLAEAEHEITVLEKKQESSTRVATARDYVLRRCDQTDTILFDECYPDTVLKNCRKIGEGVYGEVFLWRAGDGRARVLKVVPVAGTIRVNGEQQKDFHEIISEIVIAMELSALRASIADVERHFDEGKDISNLDLHSIQNATDSFNEVLAVRCVYGTYPSRLLDLWELYDECKGSENDNPAILPPDQQFIVLELANAGQDLESYQFNSAEQAYALFIQVAFGLAVGEEAFQFEHRDLHWGNVLITPSDQKFGTFILRGRAHRVPRCGVQATIIDYSLSRLSLPLGGASDHAALYNDLSNDDGLFDAVGDYQFEVYRLMRDKLGNDWKEFAPYTNILWLHYTVDKMITALRYKRTNTKIHKQYITKLKGIKNRILNYGSAALFVLTDNEY